MDIITNIEQLRAEQEKLKVRAAQQRYNLNQEFSVVKEYYSPGKILKRTMSGLFSPAENNGLAAGATGMGVSLLIERLLLKNQPLLVKLLGSYIGGNVATKSFNGIGGKLASLVGGFFGKKNPRPAPDDDTLGI